MSVSKKKEYFLGAHSREILSLLPLQGTSLGSHLGNGASLPMRLWYFWILAECFLGAVAAFGKTPIIVDTDMAIDDWLAMVYLAHHPETEMLAVTVTGAGEAHCQPGAQNAVDLMDLTPSKGIPVACGPTEPMEGFEEFPTRWRSDSDTLYGVSIPRSVRRPSREPAPDFLIKTLQQSKKPVRLVILGNATNVALALSKAPEIKKKIERIFFMGGTVWQPGNIIVPGFTDHHPNKVAEWNILIDPIAARIVLRSGVPVTLVTLDGTKDQRVSRDDVRQFTRAAKSPGAKFFSQVFAKAMWFVDSGEYYYWDALTAGVAMNQNFCKTEKHMIDVIVGYSDRKNGYPRPSFSAQRWDGKSRRNFDPFFTGQTFLSDEGPQVDVCVQSFPETFKADLIRTVNL